MPGTAVRAEAPALAAEGHQSFGVALRAADPQEAVFQSAAVQVGVELLLDKSGQRAAVPPKDGEKPRVVLLDQLVKKRRLGPVALVARWRRSCQSPGRLWQGFHGASVRMQDHLRPAANPGGTRGNSMRRVNQAEGSGIAAEAAPTAPYSHSIISSTSKLLNN